MPTEEEVLFALRSVIDPEVGMNIVDLGLIYGVEISDEKLHVDLTMTTPACPMGEMILDNARHALEAVVPVDVEIELNLVWNPPWSADKMSEHARKYFGWNGAVESPDLN
ncbi:metal-sulfur cluster assembly factor [Candidatus Ferrigenium straubiae]|jgi:metal-sulfur cluster biosynthetic enzyme|uniref:metal-sulfur cluster assembly factor n=1 Tax=Candidatus Ferrigenium straubiae TaxID=2919506 RepID=UPI003F4A9C98